VAKRKTYDDKFRASAVVMLQAAGYPDKIGSLAYVAKNLKVPSMTLSRWYHRTNGAHPNEVVLQEKRALSDRLEELAHKLIDVALIASGDDGVSVQQAAVSLGIVVDKMQLLKGEPTDRTEVIDNRTRVERINSILERGRTRRTGQPDRGNLVQ
jgi:hypothetical protein